MIDMHLNISIPEENIGDLAKLIEKIASGGEPQVISDAPPVPVQNVQGPMSPNDAPPIPPAPPAKTIEPEAALNEQDAEGYTWDQRIHAGTKNKTVKGIWKRKKSISDELYASVRAEASGFPQPDAPPVAPTVTDAPPAPPTAPIDGEVLISKVTGLIGAGTDAGVITANLNALGVLHIPDILNHPDKFAAVDAMLCSIA